ncbi:MAG: hypothetical protein PHT51_02225 [Patescibacteria group bacterium]|nr:hypothetical protein [Patescibacteria group bacterium]MDD4611300.1 hypothetical protein [Patescibacteria group bacterium]
MILSRRIYIIFSIALLLVYALISYSALALTSLVELRTIIYPVAAFVPIATSVYLVAIFGFKAYRGKTFLLFNLGFLMFFIGELLWAIKDYFFQEFPFPSVVDGFFLLGYPLLLWGLIRETKVSLADFSLKKSKLFILAMFVLSAFVFYFGIYKVYDVEANFFENLFNTLYGVGDILMIVICFFIVKLAFGYSQGKIFRPWLFITANFLIMLVADVAFAYFTAQYQENINIQTTIDLLWMVSYLLFGYGVIRYYGVIQEEISELFTKFKSSSYHRCIFFRNFYIATGYILALIHLSLSLFYSEGNVFYFFSKIIFLLIIIITIVGACYTARAYGRKNLHGRAFIFLALALTSLFIGESSWLIERYYDFNFSSYLTIGDVFMILDYPFFFLTAYYELKAAGFKNVFKELSSKYLFIFCIPLLAIIYFGIILPLGRQSDIAASLVNLFFGIGNVIVYLSLCLILLVIREYRQGKIFFSWFLVMLSVVFMILGDVVSADNVNLLISKLLSNNLWVLAYLLVGYGSISLGCIIREKQEEIKHIMSK